MNILKNIKISHCRQKELDIQELCIVFKIFKNDCRRPWFKKIYMAKFKFMSWQNMDIKFTEREKYKKQALSSKTRCTLYTDSRYYDIHSNFVRPKHLNQEYCPLSFEQVLEQQILIKCCLTTLKMLSGKYKVTKETHKHPYEFLQHSEVNNIKHRYIYIQ